jgi:Uma2 family endonuclease
MAQVTQTAAAAVERKPPTQKMTYEEFLAWCDEDTWAEWVDGEVQMVSPASNKHQDLARFLTAVLSFYIEAQDLGVIRPAPFSMRLANVPSGREPDILFVANEHRARLKESFLDGPADLVIEIISPESIGRDRGEKFVEYEASGIPEYWLIDPERQQAEFYHLGADGRYHVMNADAAGIFHSQILKGFSLRVEWLWREPLPKVVDALRELKIV